MTSLVVRTGKLSDKQLIAVLDQLFTWFPGGSARVDLPANGKISAESRVALDALRPGSETRHITSFEFEFPDTVREVVAFHRGIADPAKWGQHPNRSGFSPSLPSATFDELALLDPTPQSYSTTPQPRKYFTSDSIMAISDLLQRHASVLDSSSDDETKRLSKVVSRQVDDLRKLYIEMTEGLAKSQAENDRLFAKRQAALEESVKKRAESLNQQEADLETRRRELNDREPQHERRRLREHLTERLQQTIAEPRQATTARERWSHYLYLLVGAIFIAISVSLAAFSDVGAGTEAAAFWARSIKSFASGVAGAAFAWAGLSGLKTSAIAAREYEQAVQRYAFDMDRASWVVETILQMNSVEKAEVPEEWLEAVCRDLFAHSERMKDERSPLEAFAALFDATAKARIGTNGIDFEIDRKGARKLAHEQG